MTPTAWNGAFDVAQSTDCRDGRVCGHRDARPRFIRCRPDLDGSAGRFAPASRLVHVPDQSGAIGRCRARRCPTAQRGVYQSRRGGGHSGADGWVGDLLELRHDNGRSTRLLYLAPPSFIEHQPGHYLLLGIRPFGVPLIEDDLAGEIDYEGHTRSIRFDAADGPAELGERGLRAIAKDRWVSRPAAEAPAALIDRYRVRLDVAGQAGELDGIQLLDPTASVRYYTGRWRTPSRGDTGDFIARRPQAYGADLWCLIRFEDGAPKRLIDLPVNDPVVPGRDEAWRYQAAVDAARGLPQRVRRRASGSSGDDLIFDFFSPLPAFAERYLQLAGLALGKTPGALFSFRLPMSASDDAATFLADMLWMKPEEAPSGV